jgi:hypothetical protein
MINHHRLASLTTAPLPASAGHILAEMWKMCRTALHGFLGIAAVKSAASTLPAGVSATAHGDALDIYDMELVKMIALNGEFIATQYRRPRKFPVSKGGLADKFEPEHLFRYEGALFNCHKVSAG